MWELQMAKPLVQNDHLAPPLTTVEKSNVSLGVKHAHNKIYKHFSL